MSYQDLKALAESYPLQEREALMALAQEYRSRNEREILEIAAIATDVSLDSVLNLRLEPEANPQFLEAFRLQYPNVDIDSLSGASDERLSRDSSTAHIPQPKDPRFPRRIPTAPGAVQGGVRGGSRPPCRGGRPPAVSEPTPSPYDVGGVKGVNPPVHHLSWQLLPQRIPSETTSFSLPSLQETPSCPEPLSPLVSPTGFYSVTKSVQACISSRRLSNRYSPYWESSGSMGSPNEMMA